METRGTRISKRMAREMMVSTRVYPFSSEGRDRRGGEKGNEKFLKHRERREHRGREK